MHCCKDEAPVNVCYGELAKHGIKTGLAAFKVVQFAWLVMLPTGCCGASSCAGAGLPAGLEASLGLTTAVAAARSLPRPISAPTVGRLQKNQNVVSFIVSSLSVPRYTGDVGRQMLKSSSHAAGSAAVSSVDAAPLLLAAQHQSP